jgi:hypothetical protein
MNDTYVNKEKFAKYLNDLIQLHTLLNSINDKKYEIPVVYDEINKKINIILISNELLNFFTIFNKHVPDICVIKSYDSDQYTRDSKYKYRDILSLLSPEFHRQYELSSYHEKHYSAHHNIIQDFDFFKIFIIQKVDYHSQTFVWDICKIEFNKDKIHNKFVELMLS